MDAGQCDPDNPSVEVLDDSSFVKLTDKAN